MERKIKDSLPNNKRPGTGEEFEIDYWSKEFGISKDELKKAAKAGKPCRSGRKICTGT